ncbi:MAG: LacI family DNA-binding transcriptional regulator [Chloroflexi bacterium]|nr:LacI family DNA-binding transcriptional regulator [Chloroflexota bacterium]
MRVTIRDVAAKSGVSANTVSRVLNGKQDVSPVTRERVQAVIDELGFRPNNLARSLLRRQSHTIGHVVTDCTNPNTAQQIRAIQDVTTREGYSVVLFDTNERADRQTQSLHLLEGQVVDGIILTPARSEDDGLAKFVGRGNRLVLLNRDVPGLDVDRVMIDNRAGARAAIEHLIELGHRRIAYITGRPEISTVSERLAGYQDALAAHGITLDPHLVCRVEIDVEAATEATGKLLGRRRRPTAIFAYNDLMAVGALVAIRAAGLRVPEDISLVGHDDILYAPYLQVPLTTVAQPTREMAETAARLLVARVRGDTAPHRRIVLPPRLVVRASTAAPPGLEAVS